MRIAVLATRATFPEILGRLREHVVVGHSPENTIWTPAELIRRLQGKPGVMSTSSESVDATLLDACPQLKAVCKVGVGYDSTDVAACSARSAIVGNTPRVLTGADAGHPPTPVSPEVLGPR